MKIFTYILILLSALAACGCTSVIDKTKKIELSKSDLREIQTSEEEKLVESLSGIPLSQWRKGKPFYAADDRAALIFTGNSNISIDDHIAGDTLYYIGMEEIPALSGNNSAILLFQLGDKTLRYDSAKPISEASGGVTSVSLPMLVDLDLIEKADSLLSGRKVWTRSNLWYDANGEKTDGEKFVPVIITKVTPGNMVFPLKVDFQYGENQIGNSSMYMNLGVSGGESRSFPVIFSLTDPKLKYPSIGDEAWRHIQRSEIHEGMTKLECRLAIGNPASVNPGHDYSSTLDFWSYPDGTYIWFQDDIVTKYRH